MSSEFLSVQQAAKMLGVTALTLRNWDKSGKFTASRHPINNYRVYKKAEIEMFLEDMGSKSWNTRSNGRQQGSGGKNTPKKLSVKHED